MKAFTRSLKPALLTVALFLFVAVTNGAWATTPTNASAIMGSSAVGSLSLSIGGSNSAAGSAVISQVYNLIRFAYMFFYAIAVLLVAQAWMQFKQQKYEVMFASMGAALGLFLTPAIIDFMHGLGQSTASN
jgi:hypothetical protein